MRKLWALYINEMTKSWRKLSSVILAGIMVVGIFAFGAMMKIQQAAVARNYGDMAQPAMVDGVNKFSAQQQLDSDKARLTDIENLLKTADANAAMSLNQEKAYLLDQIDMLTLAVQMDVDIYSGGFEAEALNALVALRHDIKSAESIPAEALTDVMKAKLASDKALATRYEKVIADKDYAAYVGIKQDEIRANASLSDTDRKIQLESYDLMLKYNIKTSDPGYQQISTIESYKRSLAYNLDYSTQYPKPLTDQSRDKIMNNLAVAMYKLDKGISAETDYETTLNTVAMTGMLGFGFFIVILLMLILAGGAVSSEISTGSIKSLIISPTKRWKIFTAKTASLFTIGIGVTILMYAVSMLAYTVYFGFSTGEDYIYAINGVAHVLPFPLYRLAYVGLNFIDVIFYGSLALMLSTVTRNTAVSVGISIAVFFGGSIANSFLQLFARGEWVKLIPFGNLSVAARVFATQSNMTTNGLFGAPTVIPVSFSLAYIAVAVVCMIYIALDSFNRRDIK